MYVDTPYKSLPQLSKNTVVWRYLDIAKFLSMIDDKALFFSRSDLMTDRWEGAVSPKSIERGSADFGINGYAQMQEIRQQLRTTVYLNCWYASQHESAAMWSLYQNNGQGLAICTEWLKLIDSLRTDWPIRGGKVSYLDYTRGIIPDDDLFGPFMHKRQGFAHEREVRLILWAIEPPGPLYSAELDDGYEPSDLEQLNPPAGYAVPVDLSELTDRIYVAPDAPSWYPPLIEKVVQRYEIPWRVLRSNLAQDPVW